MGARMCMWMWMQSRHAYRGGTWRGLLSPPVKCRKQVKRNEQIQKVLYWLLRRYNGTVWDCKVRGTYLIFPTLVQDVLTFWDECSVYSRMGLFLSGMCRRWFCRLVFSTEQIQAVLHLQWGLGSLRGFPLDSDIKSNLSQALKQFLWKVSKASWWRQLFLGCLCMYSTCVCVCMFKIRA